MQEEHGEDKVYLQTRVILPFEMLILESLGGRQILEELFGKKIQKNLKVFES